MLKVKTNYIIQLFCHNNSIIKTFLNCFKLKHFCKNKNFNFICNIPKAKFNDIVIKHYDYCFKPFSQPSFLKK